MTRTPFTPDERAALRYAFTAALVTAVGTKIVEFAYDEVREVLKRRREAREKSEPKG